MTTNGLADVMSRRRALALLGAAGMAAVVAACSDGGSNDTGASSNTSGSNASGSSTGSSSGAATSTTSGSTGTTVDCIMTPEMTEGPYYLADQVIRRDVTEGKDGLPLRLELTVADAAACQPIAGLMVEIWHADATGNYSGFGSGGSNTTFLRGGQNSDANGKAVFQTIYPGWYRGRAVHIHVKVHDGNRVHTTQLFFDQDVTDQVFTQSPYQGHSGGTTNAQDDIYGDGGSTTVLKLTPSSSGYTGTINLGIQR